MAMTDEERKQRDRDYSRQRHEQDPVKVNASKLAYYYRNAAKLNGDRKDWDRVNPERVAANYLRNRERILKRSAEYAHSHPILCCLKAQKRHALKYANTPISEMLTSTEWLAILAEAAGHCTYCGREAKLTLDHVIPLSKGGKHSKDNVVPACARCNKTKGAKTLEAWAASRSIAWYLTQF